MVTRYYEALPSLYYHVTPVLTSLSLSHELFVTQPSPHIPRWRSVELTLAIPYATLHNHRQPFYPRSGVFQRQNSWASLCAALSQLSITGALRDVVLRLDLQEEDRFWWEVRETWALSAVQEPLRQCTTLLLPELTVDAETMRAFQFTTTREDQERKDESALLQVEPFMVYPAPSYVTTPIRPGATERQIPDFRQLVRYSRRRWLKEGDGDGIQARLEFFNPRDHAFLGLETVGEKLRSLGLLGGMLMC